MSGEVAAVPSDPAGFVRVGYPVAAVFLAVMALGFGIAAVLAQTSDPVRVADVGSFVVPEEAEGRALYVSADVTSALDQPRRRAGDSMLKDGGAFGLTRQVAGNRTRLVGRLGTVDAGARVTCFSLVGQRGWLAQPAGTRWLYTGMALVMLLVLTLIRLVAGAVLGRSGDGGTGPQGAAR